VARKAMKTSPQRFETLNEALAEMGRRIRTPADRWRPVSKLLSRPVQKSLVEF